MDGPQEDVDGIIHGLPDGGLGRVHPLLHRPARLELGLPELAHLRQHLLKVLRDAGAVLLRHLLGEGGVGLVLHAEKRHHLQAGQLLQQVTGELNPDVPITAQDKSLFCGNRQEGRILNKNKDILLKNGTGTPLSRRLFLNTKLEPPPPTRFVNHFGLEILINSCTTSK